MVKVVRMNYDEMTFCTYVVNVKAVTNAGPRRSNGAVRTN